MKLYANVWKLVFENNIQSQMGKKHIFFWYVKFCVCQESSLHVTFLVFEYFYSLNEKLSATSSSLSAKLEYFLTNQNQAAKI